MHFSLHLLHYYHSNRGRANRLNRLTRSDEFLEMMRLTIYSREIGSFAE